MQHTDENCTALMPRATINHLWEIAEKNESETCIFVLTTHTLADGKAQDILILGDGEAAHQTVIGLSPVDLTVEVTRSGAELTMEILPTTRAIRELAKARRRQRFAVHSTKRRVHGETVPAESRCG